MKHNLSVKPNTTKKTRLADGGCLRRFLTRKNTSLAECAR